MEKNLGELEQVLLLALLELDGEGDGASIRRAIEGRTGRVVSPGAVYTGMDRMGGRGLVASRLETTPPEQGGRRRKYYRLEPEGARALERSIRLMRRMAAGLEDRLAVLAGTSREDRE